MNADTKPGAAQTSSWLRRCRYRGPSGMRRWVRLGVIANDLLALATKTVTRCHPPGSGRQASKER